MIARTAGIAPARAVVATALPALGVALIWIFVVVFVVYPLLRVFYDAFSDESGRLTLQNFVAFAGDAFYRRSLWNSLLLDSAPSPSRRCSASPSPFCWCATTSRGATSSAISR